MIATTVIVLFLIGVCIYLGSYARWTWKKKNKIGAVSLYILALLVLLIPIYAMYFKKD